MKKKLIIVRHAKSSWDDPDLDDFERPLSSRGKKNAPEMGRRLKASGITPDLMLSSPATRALKTALSIARQVSYPSDKIATDIDLYLSGGCTILRVLRQQDDRFNTIMLFSHNEGITEFANLLSSYYLDNIATGGVVGLSFKLDSWSLVEPKSATFGFYDYPRNLVTSTYKF